MPHAEPPCLLWSDLKPEHVAQLDEATSEKDTKAIVTEALGFDLLGDTPQQHALVEFFVNLLGFTASHDFSAEKTSAAFSLFRKTHADMAEHFLPASQTWDYFQALLLAHAIQRPPYSVGIFTLSEVKKASTFAAEE